SYELFAQYHVNKILYIQTRDLEPVVIENGWLNRMDLALLCNPSESDRLQEALIHCIIASDLPILILHNADNAGRAVVEQICTWLKERHLNVSRIIDLGLNAASGSCIGNPPTRLVEMMPGELFNLLIARFTDLGIPIKSLPTQSDIRRDISKQFEQLLLGYSESTPYAHNACKISV